MIKIRVKIGDKEVEISYPISERTLVGYDSGTLVAAVKAVKDVVDKLKEE